MADAHVQVAVDGAGAKLQTKRNTQGADDVDAQCVVLVDATGTVIATLPVSGTFWQATQPVSGTVAISGSVAVTGTFFQATQPVSIASMPSTPVTGTFWQATQPVSGTFWQATQPVSGTVAVTGVATETTLGTRLAEATFTTRIPVQGQAAMAASVPVVIASNQSAVPVSGTLTAVTTITNTVPVKEIRAATPTQTSASVINSSTLILASNANRLGATVYNESGAVCYLKLGAAAGVTSYTLQIAIGGYFEIPFGYTGAIDAITASGTAVVRITELAA